MSEAIEQREISVPYSSTVASEIAEAAGDIVEDQGVRNLVQSVEAGRDGEDGVSYALSESQPVLTAAFEALCEHRADDVPDPAHFEVADIDIEVEGNGTVTINVWPGADGGDDA